MEGSDDFWRRLGWEVEFEALQQEAVIVFRFGVAREHDDTPVGRRQFDVDHLDRPELFHHRPRRQARGQRLQPLFERDHQAVGEEGDEDMGLDPIVQLMVDGSDRQVVLELLEGLFDLDQMQLVVREKPVFAQTGAVGADC